MLLIRYLLQFVEKAIDGAAVAYILILFANWNGAGAASTLAIVATCISTVGAYLLARKADRTDKARSLQAIEAIRGTLLLMLAVAGSSSIVLALAYCALLLFQALVAPIADALAIQGLDAKDRVTLFSRIYWVTNVAKLFGLVVGMFAIERGFFEWLLGGFACLSYLIAVMLSRQKSALHSLSPEKRPDVSSARRRSFGNGFLALCIGYSGAWALVHLLTTFVGVEYARKFEYGISVNWSAALLDGVQLFYFVRVVGCITAVAGQKPVNFLFSASTRLGSLGRIQIGAALYTLGMLALATSGNAYAIFVAIVVYTVGEMLFVPYVRAYAVRILSEERRVEGLFFYGIIPMRVGQLLAAAMVLFVGAPWVAGTFISAFGLLFIAGLAVSFYLTRSLAWTS